jgi:hypothetical protein
MHAPRARLLLLLALLAGLAACAARAPSIADVKYNPGRYHDRSVRVEGVVTSAWSVPLVPIRLYRVDDGTGELTVVSRRGHVPGRGARVRVTGRLGEVGMFGGRTVGLHLEEERLTVLRW